jgi:hypothetical protein
MGIYIWAIRSQGLEPNAKCFCNMHELSYETKATRKEQYHNNFGCYGFVTRSEVSNPVPTFCKRWLGAWMQEWFYVKNDLVEREDIKGIIQRSIWSHFSIRRPSLALGNDIQACQAALNTVCTYIGTRDLVQEHIAHRVWPLGSGWEMPKEAAAGSSQGDLIYLKYIFKYRSQFDEPNDDWLDAIEATSDELFGAYSRAKDDAMSTAFGGRGKKRLNRVFDVIGFVYPDYCYPSRKQGNKRRAAASVISNTAKPKKVKVLTHRPKHAETTEELSPTEESSSVFESSHSVPAEAKTESTGEPKPKKAAKQLKALSPLQEIELPKVPKIVVITPKRRRMASVLDAVIESVKASTPASALDVEGEALKKSSEAIMAQTSAEAVPSVPAEARSSKVAEESTETRPSEATRAPLMLEKQCAAEESGSLTPGAPTEELEFIVRHASRKKIIEGANYRSATLCQGFKVPSRILGV